MHTLTRHLELAAASVRERQPQRALRDLRRALAAANTAGRKDIGAQILSAMGYVNAIEARNAGDMPLCPAREHPRSRPVFRLP